MKNWSYKQVTESTEQQIASLAKSAAADGRGDAFSQQLYKGWAYGVYMGWNALTMGWQSPGDGERLEAMANAVGNR